MSMFSRAVREAWELRFISLGFFYCLRFAYCCHRFFGVEDSHYSKWTNTTLWSMQICKSPKRPQSHENYRKFLSQLKVEKQNRVPVEYCWNSSGLTKAALPVGCRVKAIISFSHINFNTAKWNGIKMKRVKDRKIRDEHHRVINTHQKKREYMTQALYC